MRSVNRMICVQLRFSLSFSMPRWRYPMTTSQSTTFSPSSRKTTRSTPCVLGCCGPMLITSSLVSNISPRTVSVCTPQPFPLPFALFDLRLFLRLAQLQPVQRIFHQQLAWSLERVVLALWEPLPVFGHQNSPPIGMARETHPEHVVDLALEPVCARPDRRH